MNHASTVLLFLIVAFVAFVAAKGTLANYIAVLWGPTAAPLPKPAATSSGKSSSSSNTASDVATALSFLGG